MQEDYEQIDYQKLEEDHGYGHGRGAGERLRRSAGEALARWAEQKPTNSAGKGRSAVERKNCLQEHRPQLPEVCRTEEDDESEGQAEKEQLSSRE